MLRFPLESRRSPLHCLVDRYNREITPDICWQFVATTPQPASCVAISLSSLLSPFYTERRERKLRLISHVRRPPITFAVLYFRSAFSANQNNQRHPSAGDNPFRFLSTALTAPFPPSSCFTSRTHFRPTLLKNASLFIAPNNILIVEAFASSRRIPSGPFRLCAYCTVPSLPDGLRQHVF